MDDPVIKDEGACEDEESISFFENQVEQLFRRCGFQVKRREEFEVEGVKEVVDFFVKTPADESIIVECRYVKLETPDYIKPRLELLVDKKSRINSNKALFVSKSLCEEPEEKDESEKTPYLRYESQGVYFWCFEDFKRLHDLAEDDLKSEVKRLLRLASVKKEGALSDLDLSGDPAARLYTGSDLEAKPNDFFSRKNTAVIAAVFIFVSIIFLAIMWGPMNAFLETLTNVFGMILVVFFVILLGLSDTKTK